MAEPMLQYWDSVLFISYMTGKDVKRTTTVHTLIRHLERRAARLVTSTFTIAEVRYYATDPRIKGKNDVASEEAVDELFQSDLVEFRAVTHFIAREALTIGRERSDLSPADCVHIATAIDARAEVLFTWDGASVSGKRSPDKMLTYDGQIGDPPLNIKEPYDPWVTLGLADGDVGELTKGPLAEPPPSAPSSDASQG